jgi:hypothetical protein
LILLLPMKRIDTSTNGTYLRAFTRLYRGFANADGQV